MASTNTEYALASGAVLFGLDVHAIQKYLFATSKLREIVGASQIVSDFTASWVREELQGLGFRPDDDSTTGPTSGRYLPVRIGGGTVRIVLPSAAEAAKLAERLMQRAIERAPGLCYDMAWVSFDPSSDSLTDRSSELIRLLNDRRMRPRGGGGFVGFPFTAPCRLTQDPAAGYGEDGNERLCEASLAKRLAQREGRGDWLEYVAHHAVVRGCGDPEEPFEVELSQLAGDDDGNAYLAVVCVDLNDLGQRGRDEVGHAVGREATRLFHNFTEKVKTAATQAFADSLTAMAKDPVASRPLFESQRPGRRLPVRPLVIGGDDLVFVMHAACGIPFAVAMLESFARNGFVGAAGMTFVKAKSPFSRAVSLAEELVSSAKSAGRGASRIDFLVCGGEVPGALAGVRASLARNDRRLFAGPWTIDEFRALVGRARTLADLPRSHVRRAADRCREGLAEGKRAFDDLRENLARGLGGRPGRRLASAADLDRLYPTGFFRPPVDGVETTDLLDCVDLFRFIRAVEAEPIAGAAP